MNAEVDVLISEKELRKRFFAPGSRPTRKDVRKWIVSGTDSGRRLRAVSLDGTYYVRLTDAVDFLAVKEQKAPKRTSSRVDAQERANERALATLRKYGFN